MSEEQKENIQAGNPLGENEEEKRHGLTLLMQHVEAGAEIEFLPHMLQRVAVYCIEVSEFTGKHREKKGQTA